MLLTIEIPPHFFQMALEFSTTYIEVTESVLMSRIAVYAVRNSERLGTITQNSNNAGMDA